MCGRRQDAVFLKRQELLEPFGITKYSTDGWGAYERHIDTEKHHVGKENTQKIESKEACNFYFPKTSNRLCFCRSSTPCFDPWRAPS